jgi:hypothetical protein
MKSLARQVVAILALATLAFLMAAPRRQALTEHERTTLEACREVIRVFKGRTPEIWPGFDLAKRPVLVYVPGKWALLLNPPAGAEGFSPPPSAWPDLGTKAGFAAGQYKDLIGQLVFDLPIGKSKAVALGIIENQPDLFGSKAATTYGFIVHEAFHQFQNDTFGEIPWEREELYPILDLENSTLAGLEMNILRGAVGIVLEGKTDEAKELVEMFIAARTERWRLAPPIVARYEQGQEVREGTASYVEKKSLELARKTAREGRDAAKFPSIGEIFRGDFESRLSNGAVSPDDMIRNRIYPAGSALGYLADAFAPGWKTALVADPAAFSFAALFRDALTVEESRLPDLFVKAKGRYPYSALRERTARLIEDYEKGFAEAMAGFSAQAGTRVEIKLKYRSISRSRSSLGRIWVVDDGAKTLQTQLRVYALKTDGLSLQVKDAALFEENDWDQKVKNVAFFVKDPGTIKVDGIPGDLSGKTRRLDFKTIELAARNFAFSSSRPGVVSLESGRVTIDLDLRLSEPPTSFGAPPTKGGVRGGQYQ